MLDTTAWPGSVNHYVAALLWFVGELLTNPRYFFRSLTVRELGRLMHERPANFAGRPHAHEMGIYKSYFDLIASSAKTVELRRNDIKRRAVNAGDHIDFASEDRIMSVTVTRVARYTSFHELYEQEDAVAINPYRTRTRTTRRDRRPL